MAIIQTTGIAFPLVLTSGKHTLVSGPDLIKASIEIILSWPLFTRFFNGQFGSRTNELLEEQNDNILLTLARRFVIDAISTWEKRVKLITVRIYRPTSSQVVMEFTYKIRELNYTDSYTHIFYTN